MNNIIYHGSFITNIKELQPYSKSHNTIKESVVYLTPNYYLALLYIWNRSYKFVTFSENDNNKVIYTEWFENQLFEFYYHVSGSIYACNMNNTNIYKTHISSVYNSKMPIKVINECKISDVYSEIIKQVSLENIIVKKYQDLSVSEKNDISKKVIRAIHLEHLLDRSINSNDIEKVQFIKEKFPNEWNIALKHNVDEINNIINNWKNLL